jgi:branched-subunit amino acid aminotransferase/4-amino-4-deoxychorismate lyase
VSRIVWLSGRYRRAEQARVSATSETLTSGVGLYETLRIVNGRAPLIEQHLRRLSLSCQVAGLPFPKQPWPGILAGLAQRNRIRNGRARITLGDGFHLVTCHRLPRGLRQEREHGIPLNTAGFQRPAAELKDVSRMSLWLAERSADTEVLLLSSRGHALETTRSNFFVVTSHGLQTAATPDVLPGIARALVLEVAGTLGIPVRFQAPSLRQQERWREAFVTNALRGVRPVASIDGIRLGRCRPDSVTRTLQAGLDQRMTLA